MADPTNEELAERLEAVEGYFAKIAEAFLLGQAATPLHVFGPANGGEAAQVFAEAAEAANIAAARLRQPLPSGDGCASMAQEPASTFDYMKREPSPLLGTLPEGWNAPENEPSADDRWNKGLHYGMEQLCHVLEVDPAQVTWDAATETFDGDVQSVIWGILQLRLGENWALPSGDGWTKIEDGEPEGDQEVYVVYRFDDGSRKVRRVLWFANAKTAKHVTHWQPARLPALPQEDE